MKTCDICGTLNFNDNNYCTFCGNKIAIENICPFCNKLNSDTATHCSYCKEQIKPVAIDSFDKLFTDYNKSLIANFEIFDDDYYNILNDVFKRIEFSDIHGNTIKEKVLSLANLFAHCETKSKGYERGFSFGNVIYYDDRLDDSIQIATIIHELSHFLLFRIIEGLMCEILGVKSTSVLQSFIWFFLSNGEISVMNEYCAHTVEGRFIPYGYQNYASFNSLIENIEMKDITLKKMIVIGNSFANEIILFLENYINKDLRDSIKLQYKRDLNHPKHDSIILETAECLELNIKNKLLVNDLFKKFEIASQEICKEELDFIRDGLEKH